jgi:hypothetical protein
MTSHALGIPELSLAIADASDRCIIHILALVDALIQRGPADQLIAPARHRLAALRPPHPLRFTRLLFHPLDRLIVPAGQWAAGEMAIPRSALPAMTGQVRQAMGGAARAIDVEIAGRTTADTGLIASLGRSLWPAAATILADTAVPDCREATALGAPAYRALASLVATLLAGAPALDTLCAETASRLLAPDAETVAALLARVVHANPVALPAMVTLLLDRLPETAGLFHVRDGKQAAAIRAAMDAAADRLLGQLDQPAAGPKARIAAGTLADTGATVKRIATLLRHMETPDAPAPRRERLRSVRQRLDSDCKARFIKGLRDDLLAPLRHPEAAPDIAALEAAARGLRILAAEARVAGSGPTYDLLLAKTAEAMTSHTVRDRLSLVDRLRLVELLQGPDAALAMLDSAP